jgi:preprotein translocase YajC subunit
LILALAIAYPAAIAILFYFAFLRPVQQERSRQRKELANLQVGDEVLTQGGLIATVKEVRVPEERGPTEVVLDLGGLDVRAHTSAIAKRLKTAEEPSPAPASEAATNTDNPTLERADAPGGRS